VAIRGSGRSSNQDGRTEAVEDISAISVSRVESQQQPSSDASQPTFPNAGKSTFFKLLSGIFTYAAAKPDKKEDKGENERSHAAIVPISMQRQQDRSDGAGVSEPVWKMATRIVKRPGMFPRKMSNHTEYKVAVKRSDGRYWVRAAAFGDAAAWKLAQGHYVFVRLLDGTLRLNRSSGGKSDHARTAGYAMHVAYPGEIVFKDGRPSEANNQSSTYCPDAKLFRQAGFDELPEESWDFDPWVAAKAVTGS